MEIGLRIDDWGVSTPHSHRHMWQAWKEIGLRSEYSAAAQLSSCRRVLLAGIFAIAAAVIRIMGLLTWKPLGINCPTSGPIIGECFQPNNTNKNSSEQQESSHQPQPQHSVNPSKNWHCKRGDFLCKNYILLELTGARRIWFYCPEGTSQVSDSDSGTTPHSTSLQFILQM